jgi:hypothetical protein
MPTTRGQVARQRVVGAGVDKGGAAFVAHDQIRGIELRAMEAGVDGEDSVTQVLDEWRQ